MKAAAVGRVRAGHPFVRVRTATVARADSRLSDGFVAGPECDNHTPVHKDGCGLCTACAYVGQCG